MPARPRVIAARLRASARNALEIARFGRLGEAHGAPFDVVDVGPHHRLRRYEGARPDAPVALLVPPLMITAEVYDIAPEISAILLLLDRGVAPWVVDFGAPEHEAGGMDRSLDDHVRAVVRAIGRTRELTGRNVHLCGYSQGGMFAYQAASYLKGEGIRSIVTFGSPVDLHKGLPAVRSDLTGALAQSIFPLTRSLLERLEGLPGKVTSTAFKLLSTRKEVEQRIDFLRSIHDRDRILKREARRHFIKGAGFVAWPGPALRAFVEDFVVHNRMLSGGFVIDGRTVSLADLRCPILAFIGATDELARAPTIRALADAAPEADVRFETVPAGHFGIVVGSRARERTWPTVSDWIFAIEGGATAEAALPVPSSEPLDELDPGDLEVEIDLFFDVVTRGARDAWRRLGDTLAGVHQTAETVRWREPRLRRLARIEPETKIGPSRELARRAFESPESTFFLWRGRAFSYRDADVRVTNVARGLHACGIRRGERVGVIMGNRPSLLSASTALARLGAVGVIAPATSDVPTRVLQASFDREGVRRVIVDPERATRATELNGEVLVLGGGGRAGDALGPGVRDLEAIDPSTIHFPADLELDPGRARDVVHVLLRPGQDDGQLRAVPITNHRWALSAIGAAAACAIKPSDTVCCAVPLHHPTGLIVSVGAAIAGGARLALIDLEESGSLRAPLDARAFLLDLRRVGATVVFYAGEMLRPLVAEALTSPADRHLPVRIFAGSGMRPDLASRLRAAFGIDTMEFYAGTAHRAILADPASDHPGSLGDVLPGSADVRLVRCDLTKRARVLDRAGHLVLAADHEPALLAVRVSPDEIETLGDTSDVLLDAFGDGDAWLVASDVVERDAAGRHWFIDSLGSFVVTHDRTPVSLRRVEDALYTLPEIRLAAAWDAGAGTIGAAFVSTTTPTSEQLAGAMEVLPRAARPVTITRVAELPLTEGFRVSRPAARASVARAMDRWHLTGDGYASA